jgi:hypothetical protein
MVKIVQYDFDKVMQEWENRDEYDILADIQNCEEVEKGQRNARQRFIAKHHIHLLKMHKARTGTDIKMNIMISDPSIVDLKQIIQILRFHFQIPGVITG